MSSLADLSELVGFFSYSRRDDTHSEGALSRLRGRIHGELRLQLGRDFRLWQDTAAIPEGALWEDEIARAIAESVFFIPIVTPSSVSSHHCRFEFESFLKREAELGRSNLIFPILYVRVAALEREAQWRGDELLSIIGARQYIDWQDFRHRDLKEPEVARKVEGFCRSIVETLQQPWVSAAERQASEERRRQAGAEAQRRAQADARVKAEAEAHAKAEQERLAREAQERRRAEALARVRQAADDEARQRAKAQQAREPAAGVLADGRARLALGFAMLTGAALLSVLAMIAVVSMGRFPRHDELAVFIALILYSVLGLLTMRGAPAIRSLATAALSLAALAALATTGIGFFYSLAEGLLWAGFTATNILAITVCLRGWTPLQRPLLAKASSLRDRGILLALLAYPLWVPCAWFLASYRFIEFGQFAAVCGLLFALGLCVAAWGAWMWGSAVD